MIGKQATCNLVKIVILIKSAEIEKKYREKYEKSHCASNYIGGIRVDKLLLQGVDLR